MDDLSEPLRDSLRQLPAGTAPPPELTARLLGELDTQLGGELLYTEARFRDVHLRPLTRSLLPRSGHRASEEERTRINRLLFEDAFPGTIRGISEERARHGAPRWTLVFLVIDVLLATLCLYALRGLYYALLSEGGVPVALTGTATGVVSVLGYTPDIFLPPTVGYLLDRFPGGAGYRFVYALVALFCVVGLTASITFLRRTRRRAERKRRESIGELLGVARDAAEGGDLVDLGP